ncbi:9252_t:CDS:1, partial [Funneliformis geosporum]
TSTQYTNEDPEIKYSRLVAEVTLTGRINRNSFQTALATIGVTNQCSKQSYHNYQNRMYKPIIESAKFSCKTILLEIFDQLEANHLLGQEKILSIGFDYF